MDIKSFYEKDFLFIRNKVNELSTLPNGVEKSNLMILSSILLFQSQKGRIRFFEDIKNRRDLNGKLKDICDFSYIITSYSPICFEMKLNTAYQADMKRFHWVLINYSRQFPKVVLSNMKHPIIICNPVDKQNIIESF